MTAGSAGEPGAGIPPVDIVIRADGAGEKLVVCLESLVRHAPANSVVYVLGHGGCDEGISKICEDFRDRFSKIDYIQTNVYPESSDTGRDVLFLHFDTEVTTGFLEEMQAVLHFHEKHAMVTPRSNNADLFSIPPIGDLLLSDQSYDVWRVLRKKLPRYQVMPSAAGFCMLVKGSILDRFIQSIDEMHSFGCGGEEEFLCRINRYGYSAVAANWAYVFHHGSPCSASNRKVPLEGYPEYERKVGDFLKFQIEPLETFAILHVPHRPRILYDLFHLPAMHSGTSDFGLNLLREIGRLLEGDFDLHVGIDQSLPFFANELRGYRIYDDRSGTQLTFDLVYKPCQLFTWQEFNRMNRFSPRLSYTMLDIIGVRCDYLSSPARRFLFRKTAELADLIFTISEFSRSDFAAFYGAGVPMKMIHLGTDAHIMAGKFSAYEHVLVMGNAFPHKGVMEAVHHLDPSWPVVVLGGTAAPTYVTPNVRWLTSGQLSRQDIRELFAKARILIYPSHYEGFGLPVVDALALGKPVVVLDSAVNRELATATQNHNLHLIQSIKQLQDTVRPLLDMPTSPPPHIPPRRWREVAEDYVGTFRKLLERDPDLDRLRARWDLLRMIQSAGRGFDE